MDCLPRSSHCYHADVVLLVDVFLCFGEGLGPDVIPYSMAHAQPDNLPTTWAQIGYLLQSER
jgi:hypothetical protein